jgi:hypothetical protein
MIDLTERLKKYHYAQMVDKNIVVNHKHGNSMETVVSRFKLNASHKSKIKFYTNYYKSYLLFMFISIPREESRLFTINFLKKYTPKLVEILKRLRK